MKPYTCCKCSCDLEVAKNGVLLVVMSEERTPLSAWMTDTWKCPVCGMKLTLGFGEDPVALLGRDKDFEVKLRRLERGCDEVQHNWTRSRPPAPETEL